MSADEPCPYPHCPLPEEHDGPHYGNINGFPVKVAPADGATYVGTLPPEVAAKVREGRIHGMSITGASGAVWPL